MLEFAYEIWLQGGIVFGKIIREYYRCTIVAEGI